MKKTNNRLKSLFILVPALLYFFAWRFITINEMMQSQILPVCVGVCSVLFLFSILVKEFDAKKTVSSFFILLVAVSLIEPVLFAATNGYELFGKYGFLLKFIFKNLKLVCMFRFYQDYLDEKFFWGRMMILLGIVCDVICVCYPWLAFCAVGIMGIMTIATFVELCGAKRRKSDFLCFAHLLMFGSIASCGFAVTATYSGNVAMCGFVSTVLADTLWLVGYLKEIVKIRNEEVEYAKKKLDRKSEEMSVMLSQIKPHFIYNTLNTIQYLCRTDGELAADTISDFSDYLRTNLNFDSNRQIVPFNEELEHVNKYLRIEKLRFKHRLMVKYDIQEEDFLVPTLSLQPIIENAVKHGISKRLNGGTITITTYMDDDNYVIQIKDNGVGFTEKERAEKEKNQKRKSLGLKNIQSRIENLLDGKLEIVSRKERGTTATIFLPIEKNLEEMQK